MEAWVRKIADISHLDLLPIIYYSLLITDYSWVMSLGIASFGVKQKKILYRNDKGFLKIK